MITILSENSNKQCNCSISVNNDIVSVPSDPFQNKTLNTSIHLVFLSGAKAASDIVNIACFYSRDNNTDPIVTGYINDLITKVFEPFNSAITVIALHFTNSSAIELKNSIVAIDESMPIVQNKIKEVINGTVQFLDFNSGIVSLNLIFIDCLRTTSSLNQLFLNMENSLNSVQLSPLDIQHLEDMKLIYSSIVYIIYNVANNLKQQQIISGNGPFLVVVTTTLSGIWKSVDSPDSDITSFVYGGSISGSKRFAEKYSQTFFEAKGHLDYILHKVTNKTFSGIDSI